MIALREQDVHADPRTLMAAWQSSRTFALLPDKLGAAHDWLAGSLGLVPAALGSDHFVMLTSGSTGLPKLIVGSRDRAERLARVLHERQDSHVVAETIALLPLSYTYSFVNQWLWSHVMQRRFVPTEGLSNPAGLRRAFERAENAMVCLVGVQVPMLVGAFAGASFPGVIRVHFAGGRFPQERLRDVALLFPNASVFNNYGCAEAMPRLTLRGAHDANEAANVGWPLPGIELRADERQAIQFRSPYAAVGVVESGRYRAIEVDEWVPSGDMGQRNPDGSWALLGRASEVFKRHGEKVSLAALTTTVASAWPGQFAFYRELDSTGEEGCVLAIAGDLAPEKVMPILMSLRKHHVRAHWPLRIECIPSLPLLSNGKADILAISKTPTKSVLWKQHI